MEIAWVAKQGIRIKGKHATVMFNPLDDTIPCDASIYFPVKPVVKKSVGVPVNGPGEYEIGGVKISGVKNKENTVYSLNVDGVDILVGDLQAVSSLQHKLKEHNIVLLHGNSDIDASFVNGFATNVVMMYGERAKEILGKFAKEGLQEVSKYQVTKEKLPQEIQTVLLA